ncbi:MAG: alpha/beta hydrolase [Proteobacteria bacterium]|nr:alpha/beta hydrolase [Pseudomonadota bacterium]
MSENPLVRSVNVSGFEIKYLFYEGEGPDLVLLHATGFLPWLWHPIARRLAGKYRIIAPYFCDHRVEDPRKGGVSWALLAEDMIGFLRALRLRDPFLAGHSMGGTVLTLVEALFGPLARKMILIEPIYLPTEIYRAKITVEEHPLANKSIKRRNRWKNTGEAETYLRSKELFRNWDQEMLDLYVKYGMKEGEGGGLELVCHPDREAALFVGSAARDPWPLLPKLTCPVFFLEGEESPNRGFIDLGKAAAMMPRAERRIIPGSGHLVPMEKPAVIAEIIEEFFKF